MTDTLAALSLSAEQNPEILFRAAAESLSSGRGNEAFALADRLCRILPLASANHFLLRAATRRAVGDPEGSLEDVRRALEVDPVHLIANRALLAGGNRRERENAARILLSIETEPSRQITSIRALAEGNDAVGLFRGEATGVTGFLAWRGDPVLPLDVMRDFESDSMLLCADAGHPLRDALGNAASWSSPWREGVDRILIKLPRGIAIGSPTWNPATARPQLGTALPRSDRRRAVAVLVPVYSDYQATEVCLQTLLDDEITRVTCRILVIDDAAPDTAIAAMLDRLTEEGKIELLRNPYNVGFARSINRALQHVPGEDVLLLNADTILPKGFLDGLSRVAHSAPDIGTVTPLSNNGEYTSIPTAFRANELPDRGAVQMISDAASIANGERTVDLPNGIGFCLYIRRDCLDEVGVLSLAFGRGYYEDVEFCLRAASRGWRNVCATGVYIGHAGARSFASEKPVLVKHGAAVLDRIHPGFARASTAFVRNDPLSDHRQALERELMPNLGPYDLAVIPELAGVDWLELVPPASNAGRRRLAALVKSGAGRITISLREAGGGFPQNLALSPIGFKASLASMKIADVDVFDPMRIPGEVLEAVLQLGRPITVRIRDLGALCQGERTTGATNETCEVCAGRCPLVLEPLRQDLGGDRGALKDVIERAEAIIVPDEDSRGLFDGRFSAASTIVVARSEISFGRCIRSTSRDRMSLGAIVDPESANTAFLIAIAERFSRSSPSLSLTVLGSTSDDFRLMMSGPAFVTGPVQRHEFPALLGNLGIARLLFPSRRFLPSQHLVELCRVEGIPTAMFRWSVRQPVARSGGDLEMPAATASDVAADLVLRWVTGGSIG
jgi:O-antigen biosynthesis protein